MACEANRWPGRRTGGLGGEQAPWPRDGATKCGEFERESGAKRRRPVRFTERQLRSECEGEAAGEDRD